MTPQNLVLTLQNGFFYRLVRRTGPRTVVSDNEGKTVLIYAALGGYADIARALLTSGADVNAIDNTNGETALMRAAAGGDSETVRALLERRPIVDLKSKSSGLTALGMAVMNGHGEIADLLRRAGARDSQ